jgi:hypothetical protein
MNDLPYIDTEHRAHTLAVIDCLETRTVDGQPQTTRFRWVTNFNVMPTTVLTLANQGGRLRWKIENGGASTFKNTGATRWNTPTLRTRPLPKSFTSSCRSPICSAN